VWEKLEEDCKRAADRMTAAVLLGVGQIEAGAGSACSASPRILAQPKDEISADKKTLKRRGRQIREGRYNL
jgi:hypothetical protein